MKKTLLNTALVLVGGHLVLGFTLLAIEAIRGLSDQDASYVVMLAFYYLNLPSFWVLRSMGFTPSIPLVMAVGSVQWMVLTFAICIALYASRSACRAITDRAAKTAEPGQ